MKKPGRKSAAAEGAPVASAAPTAGPPPAPVSLGEDGARRWSAIVGSRPADYFGESDLLLLEDMIRSEQFVTDCDQLIAEHGHVVTGSTGALVVNPAVNARKGYIATITTIQRALRLPPSTRYDKKSAKLGSTASKRPWQE